jgi:acyl-CoA oxidase
MSVLKRAIEQSQVSKEELTKLENSVQQTEELKKVISAVKENLTPQEYHGFSELSRVEQVKQGYLTAGKLIEAKKRLNIDHSKTPMIDFVPDFEVPGTVSHVMVRPIIDVLGSDEQKKKWLPLLDSSRVIGAYAQTELGHGSDVQGIETEAVYDPKTKEFVINSPTVSSYKWWPGELGHLSNIVVLFARVMIGGKKVGVFPIIVQTRDMTNHHLLPGIDVGDIGPKFGYQSKENGFMRFTNVRVSKDNMLSRFFEINDEGDFQLNGNPKIIYSAMMNVRTFLLISSVVILSRGVLIALRYSHLRKQFKDDRKQEVPVIEYQLQQYKLYPLLAKIYVMKFGYFAINQRIEKLVEEVKNDEFKNLQECHILLCGAKAMYTWWANNNLYTCMQCCGGHGYSQLSGIPYLIQSFAPTSILEGENSMLCMQVGQHVLKCYKNMAEGKLAKLSGSFEYFKGKDTVFNNHFKQLPKDFAPAFFIPLLQKGVLSIAEKLYQEIHVSPGESSVYHLVNRKKAVRLFDVAKLHIMVFSLQFFVDRINESTHAPTKAALSNLANLFAIDSILEYASVLLDANVLGSEFLAQCKSAFEELLEKIHPDALFLAEHNIPDDFMLYSAIADTNEKPYENLYNLAKAHSIMNKVDLSGFYLETIRKASLEAYPVIPKL